ncbi:helix-turn-helix domain-containing protein [Achromobacter sp. GG226]|uniref:helix-turn-helix transcriptional regulator n=1 Tax=Verticiella alkaliphila TaxID=2779529 RepID=UPI001C0BA724|nr:helix-turn-helix transcriptional regulator [Verticiella sp. GG226]MBU4612618.1 helix-turn-helix domain-containing protein [Verticiella sp. GG226]
MADYAALGAFLRRHREALSPAQAGLAGGTPRRRTPGLRREELALAAGISLTWVTWLEQGRPVAASPGALARLAEALRLTAAERTYLFELAGRVDPDAARLPSRPPLPPALAAALETTSAPAYVLDHGWDARAWNAPAQRLFRGWLDGPEKNLLRFVFQVPSARTLIDDWETRAHRIVAECRASTAGRQDETLQTLVQTLQQQSPEFAACWRDQRVLAREGGRRVFRDPEGGRQVYEQLSLAPAATPEFTLVMLLPAATTT